MPASLPPGDIDCSTFEKASRDVQEFLYLSGRAFRNIVRSPHYADDIFLQMDAIGVGSLFIVSLTVSSAA